MSETPSSYPKNTVMGQAPMNIYANKKDNSITMMYDTPLTAKLLGIEYITATQELMFEFESGKIMFGMTVNDDIHVTMQKAKKITFIQVDLKTVKPVMGFEVPLTII